MAKRLNSALASIWGLSQIKRRMKNTVACPLSQPCCSRNIRLISCVRDFTACTVRVLLHIAKVVLRFGLQSCFSVCRFCPSNNSNSSTDATRIDIFRQPGCETSVQQTREEVGLSWTSVSCLLYTSPSPRDGLLSRMPSSA